MSFSSSTSLNITDISSIVSKILVLSIATEIIRCKMYREKAVSDAIAGVTVGLTVIPQVNLVSIVINIVLAPLLLLLLLPLFFCQVNMIITRASPMQWWPGSSLNMVFTPPSWDALPIASLAGATSRIRSQPFYKYLRIIYNDELFSARKTSQSVPRRSWRS